MKNLKLLFFLFFSIIVLSLYSQEKRPNKEKIKELKIAFLTEKLDLTVKEAEKFWPVYNKHDAILREIRIDENLKIRKKIKSAGSLAIRELSTFLPYNKILKFQIAEREFGRKLLARYKRGRNNKK